VAYVSDKAVEWSKKFMNFTSGAADTSKLLPPLLRPFLTFEEKEPPCCTYNRTYAHLAFVEKALVHT